MRITPTGAVVTASSSGAACRSMVFRADGAFGQYGVVFEDKDTVLILQSSSSNQQEQLTCAWEALLPAITDEETLPESPMAHVLKKRLEKRRSRRCCLPATRGPKKRLRVRNSRLRRKFRGLSISSAVCGLMARRAVGRRRCALNLRPKKANLVFEQDNGEFTAEIGLQSHFTSFYARRPPTALWVAGAVTSALSSKFAVRNPQAADE